MDFRSLAGGLAFIFIAVIAFLGVANTYEDAYSTSIVSEDLNRTQTKINSLQSNFESFGTAVGNSTQAGSGAGEASAEEASYKRYLQAITQLPTLLGIGESMMTDAATLLGVPEEVTRLAVTLLIIVFGLSLAYLAFSIFKGIF